MSSAINANYKFLTGALIDRITLSVDITSNVPANLRLLVGVSAARLTRFSTLPPDGQLPRNDGSYPVPEILSDLAEVLAGLAYFAKVQRRLLYEELAATEGVTEAEAKLALLLNDREGPTRSELREHIKTKNLALGCCYAGLLKTAPQNIPYSTLTNHGNLVNHALDLAQVLDSGDPMRLSKLVQGMTNRCYVMTGEAFVMALLHYLQIRVQPVIITMTIEEDPFATIIEMAYEVLKKRHTSGTS